MVDKIRYGIIGSGMMGIEHIMNINMIPNSAVAAIADPHEGSRNWSRDTASNPIELYSDYRDMLEKADLDAVIVAAPNFTHAKILDALFETDLHILCEKPLCTTFDDAKQAALKSRTHKGVFWVGMEYRYMPPVTRFVAEVHSGTAGQLKMFSIREHRYPFLKKVGDWNRFNVNTGGTLVEKCCHYFDMMRHVVRADPVRVFASGGQSVNHLDERYDGKVPDILDNAFVVVDFENGVRAMHDLCMFAEASRNQEEMAAVGDAGKIECLIPAGDLVFGTRASKKVETLHVPVSAEVLKAGYHHGASYFQHLAFQDAIRNQRAPAVSARDGLWAVAMGLAAQRSIAEGRVVQMSEFEF
mgnify:CR=1 FL=1|tara:strand:+ start:27082 stop:28149 length:1068 start_codon:yes stop_codon:yes gene_type:complete